MKNAKYGPTAIQVQRAAVRWRKKAAAVLAELALAYGIAVAAKTAVLAALLSDAAAPAREWAAAHGLLPLLGCGAVAAVMVLAGWQICARGVLVRACRAVR